MIGRQAELNFLKRTSHSNKAELGIIYGRRRIGKSTLLQSLLKKGDLYFEGIKGYSKQKQIRHFTQQLAIQTNTVPVDAKSWDDAFRALTTYIEKKRIYVVFDELPWMASGQKELIALLKYFWDNHWKKNTKLHMVLCGSIASFMVKHVVHSEALHNRKTYEFKLGPLPIEEAYQFFPKLPSELVLKYLLIFGGIPKYLEQIRIEDSFNGNINKLCFRKNSFFLNEFDTVFKEQFKTAKTYTKIVKALSQSSKSKEELAEELGISPGGGFTEYLNNLEMGDFIRSFNAFNFVGGVKDKTRKYYLWDEWLRFYFSFIKPNESKIRINTSQDLFSMISEGRRNQYFGIAFENLILKNVEHLFRLLDISLGEIKNFGPFFRFSRTPGGKGVQIDLLIETNDNTLTLVECKNAAQPIGESIIREIDLKIKSARFPKKYFLRKVLVTGGTVTSGLKKKGYFSQIIYFEDFLKS
ncbi:MAG: ATP-binding protein [Bdellovibrio sp.]